MKRDWKKIRNVIYYISYSIFKGDDRYSGQETAFRRYLLSRITDGRFKTNRISITFYNEFSEGRRSDYAILPYILTDSCRNYPNLTRLTERYSDLYGASVSDNLGCSWDRRSMTFTISSIDDRYTLDGESWRSSAATFCWTACWTR